MTYHSIVRDLPFNPGISVVGKLWLPGDEAEDTGSPDFLCEDGDDFEEHVETKVVTPERRGRRPGRPTEGVETK